MASLTVRQRDLVYKAMEPIYQWKTMLKDPNFQLDPSLQNVLRFDLESVSILLGDLIGR